MNGRAAEILSSWPKRLAPGTMLVGTIELAD